jgi:hypothetical protein
MGGKQALCISFAVICGLGKVFDSSFVASDSGKRMEWCHDTTPPPFLHSCLHGGWLNCRFSDLKPSNNVSLCGVVFVLVRRTVRWMF